MTQVAAPSLSSIQSPSLEGISPEDIAYLADNIHKLSPELRQSLRTILNQKQTGCRTNRWMNFVRPNLHPKQKLFLSLDHREVMFGGAAGGSKSDSLLLSMMQYLDVPGYSSIIFRRTFKDLSGSGSIMDRAKSWFAPLEDEGVRWSASDNSFYFPTGSGQQPSRFAFAYLQHDDDKRNYQGWELNACVKTSTLIAMGDGSFKTVGEIRVGDIVATPEGPRPIVKTWNPQVKKCVEMQVFDASGKFIGTQVQSTDHAFASTGEWVSYDQFGPLESIQLHCRDIFAWQPENKSPMTLQARDSQSGRLRPQSSRPQSQQDLSGQPDSFSCLASDQSDFGESDGLLQERLQPPVLFGPLMLFSPQTQSVPIVSPPRDDERGPVESLAPDFQFDCLSCCRFCDEQLRCQADSCQYESTSPADAEASSHRSSSRCDRESSREYSLQSSTMFRHQESTGMESLAALPHVSFSKDGETCDRISSSSRQVALRHLQSCVHLTQPTLARRSDLLPHPYADRMLEISEPYSVGSFSISNTCEAEVRNIQVAGSSCYITEMGICNRNCAFDELTQHPRDSYSYLFSRLRRLKGSGIPVRMRSATNPGGKFGDWVKEDFIPDEYLALSDDPDAQFSRVWEKKTDCGECRGTGIMDAQACIYCEGMGYRTRLFVPSRIQDNPSLDRAEYLRSLINLPPVERYRLEKGDWAISELGNLFKPEWVRYYSRSGDHFRLHRPDATDIIASIQEMIFFVTADTASKEKTSADYTCISTWAFHQKSGSIALIHVLMTRMEVPQIANAILNQSVASRASFVMVEDAQCGIGVLQELRGPKGKGLAVMSYSPHGTDKIARSTTAQIKMEAGQIYFPQGNPGWLTDPYAQMVGFPQATHDDFVDTLAMAAHWAHSRHQVASGNLPGILPPVGRYLSSDITRGLPGYGAY